MKIAVILALSVACVTASGYNGNEGAGNGGYGVGGSDSAGYAPASYNFGYDVSDQKSYVDMGHNENRNGDTTKGAYYVNLPDGRLQKN